MFSKLNWLSFSERVKYRKATLVFKCVNRMTPRYMTNLFTPLTHIRETRQSTRMALTIPFAKKNCYATSFAVSGVIMWNDLHPQLRTITCLTLCLAQPLYTYRRLTLEAFCMILRCVEMCLFLTYLLQLPQTKCTVLKYTMGIIFRH